MRFWSLLILSFWLGGTGQIEVAIAIPAPIERTLRGITVRIEGQSGGTGVIVDRQGQTYRVLTSGHIFQKSGDRVLVTADGYCHAIASVSPLPELDLALLQFASPRNYAIAKRDDTQSLPPDRVVYVGGWAASGGMLQSRVFLITEGIATAARSNLPSGYALTYSNLVRVGMSGGAVLSDRGSLIGINGIVRYQNARSDEIVASGIPIYRFSQWYARNRTALPAVSPRSARSPCP